MTRSKPKRTGSSEIGNLNHLEELDGQRHIAEDALATAIADLQAANDNLFAAQNEIAATAGAG